MLVFPKWLMNLAHNTHSAWFRAQACLRRMGVRVPSQLRCNCHVLAKLEVGNQVPSGLSLNPEYLNSETLNPETLSPEP